MYFINCIIRQASIPGGLFWFGTQIDIKGKIVSTKSSDGSKPRKKVIIR